MNLGWYCCVCTCFCVHVTFLLCSQFYLHVLQSVFLYLQYEVGIRQAKQCYTYASLLISRLGSAMTVLEFGETVMGLIDTNLQFTCIGPGAETKSIRT
jgi:hypothetical protein